jgi:glycosyltransferase involved in cell wall biosynthesis
MIAVTDSSDIKLSIALVTRNRPEWLRQCLSSWRSQSMQPFEIVVSDDSDSSSESNVETIAKHFGCRYVKGPGKGLYANRNCAALSCRGSHIMSADDDHTHPDRFVENILSDVATDLDAVWTYSEKHPLRPEAPITPVPELTPSNRILPPKDSTHSAAIADGSTVYPRLVFDSGLRYDETYPFGMLWYLWGHDVNRGGFRICFSDSTYVWHHTDSSIDRGRDLLWLEKQIECNLYVLFRNAIREDKNAAGLLRATLQLLRASTGPTSPTGVTLARRLRPRSAFRAVMNAMS